MQAVKLKKLPSMPVPVRYLHGRDFCLWFGEKCFAASYSQICRRHKAIKHTTDTPKVKSSMHLTG